MPTVEITQLTRRGDVGGLAVLATLPEINDPRDAAYFVIPPGTGVAEIRTAVLATYVFNTGTGYGATGRNNDFPDTPYGAEELARIAQRQAANAWSYPAARRIAGTGGALATTPNGILIGIGGSWIAGRLSQRGGTTYGDIFLVNLDHRDDPTRRLRQIIESGVGWHEADGKLHRGRLPLARLLHHEERHSRQWARLGPARMGVAYLGEELRARLTGGVNRFEEDAGLADGGYV